MKDPYRITRVLCALRAFWTKNPDLRLGQLLLNFEGENLYNLEDDELEKRLKAALLHR